MKTNRYQGWHIKPNQQNSHMMKSLIDLSKTMHQLIKMGITVTSTETRTKQPTIQVLATNETKKLKGAVIKTRNKSGQRSSVYTAQLNNCTIEWESNYVY